MNITNVKKVVQKEQQELSNEQLKDTQNEQNSFKSELNALLMQNNIVLAPTDRTLLLNSASEAGATNLSSTKILSWAKDLHSIKSEFNYNTMTMDKDDAVFFAGLTENIPAQVSFNNNQINVNMEALSETADTEKTIRTSKTLSNIIENCYKTGQSARIDFDNNISVIMRIDRQGKVSAEFIPSDKVAEQYLKNNIAFLRQTFDEQNLPYNELSYRQQGGKKNSDNNKNKEK